jgi:hypothetical protein
MQFIGPVAGHQCHPTRPRCPSQERDQVAGGAVGPVQILQHHYQRGSFRPTQQQDADGVKDLQLIQAIAIRARRPGPRHPWHEPAEAGRGHGKLSKQLRLGPIIGKTTQGVHHR